QVGGGPGGHGHAKRVSVQLAVQFGQHQTDRLGGTGTGGHDIHRSCASTAEILVRAVLQCLVGGVGVHRGHQPALDTEVVVENLRQRCQAVGGAGRIRNDRLCAVVLVVVDPQHDGEVLPLGWSGHDHLL